MKPILSLAGAALAAALSLSAHAVGRLADIAIFDRSAGRELPVHWHEGKPYVVGRPGNEYEIRVRNRAGEDLLAVVSVDGVNVVSGETASPRQGGYVLSSRDSTRIAGWRKSLGETAAFYFTSLGDSYAGRTGRPANVGVIGVALFQRRHAPPPMLEAPHEPWGGHSRRERHSSDSAAAPSAAPRHEAQAESRLKSAPLGTGHGRRESSPVREVEFERRTRDPVEIIAIRYDSYRNLVAQGVLRSASAMRDPNPFPTRFAPDP
jgi:hypothetical protein